MKSDYKNISENYNSRYHQNSMSLTLNKINDIIANKKFSKILDVGCGTAHWLKKINHELCNRNNLLKVGLDYSREMLSKANDDDINLVNGSANCIPFKFNSFDLIITINAIHHFGSAERFIESAFNLISVNGKIIIVSVDLTNPKHYWYVYNYFDGTRNYDLKRIPSKKNILKYLADAGFKNVFAETSEIYQNVRIGNDVFDDHFLTKLGNSTLADLSDDDYARGIELIKLQIAKNPQTQFRSSIVFTLFSGTKK